MGVYYVAVANGVLVPIRTVDVCEDVVDGIDTVHWACCEFPLGDEGVPADPTLTLLGLWANLYGTRTKVDHNALA